MKKARRMCSSHEETSWSVLSAIEEEQKSRVIGPIFVLLEWEGGFHAESRTQEHIHGSRDWERDTQQLRPEQWGLRLDGSRRHNKRRSTVCFIS